MSSQASRGDQRADRTSGPCLLFLLYQTPCCTLSCNMSGAIRDKSNPPFVEHIAFMGLEMMGYTKTNLKTLWIDPLGYQDALVKAVSGLALRGMNVSIYNHQLCVLRRTLWRFARKSISDFKNIYLDTCQECAVLEECGGLFKSGEQIHSQHIRALSAADLGSP